MSSMVLVIFRWAMKPVWSWWMKGLVRLMSWILFARMVERILRSVLERVMGQRLDMMVQSWFFLGMRMVWVSFQGWGRSVPLL